jgi:hypothetical protein
MVKLPDLYSQSRIASAVSPPRAQTVSSQEASQGTRALQDASEKFTKLVDNERKAYVQAKAMELDAELDNELFEIEKKAKTSTNPEAIEQEFEARSAAAKKKYLEWLPDREMARRLEGRYEQKIGSARRGIFNRTFDLRKQRTIEGYETGVRKSFQNIGDLNFPEERIPQIIMEQNANLRLACESGAINTVDCARIEDKYIKDAVKTWSERKTLKDPGAHTAFLENYLKAKKSGALDAYSKFQPADKGARAKMATMMFDSEARKDGKGRVQIYELPPGDGGGSYEVAGINDRFHPEMAAKLAGLVRRGNHAEAERQAKAHYQKITDKAGQVVADKGAGVEYVMRDIALNRGHGGALATLRLALGNDDVSPGNQRAAYAPLTADEKRKLAEASPEMLVRQLTMARKIYEDRFAGARPQFREGLQNRWAKVEREAMGLGATPAEAEPGDRQNLIPLPPEMEVGRELLGKLSDVEVQELLDKTKSQLQKNRTTDYYTKRAAAEGLVGRIKDGFEVPPEMEAEFKQNLEYLDSIGRGDIANKIRLERRQAEFYRAGQSGKETINKDVKLSEMTPTELAAHEQGLVKLRRKADATESGLRESVNKEIATEIKRLKKLRSEDPAKSVENNTAVRGITEQVKEAQAVIDETLEGDDAIENEGDIARLRFLRAQKIEARLAEQERIGIGKPRLVTDEEAKDLLQISVTSDDRDAIKKAVNSAFERKLEELGDAKLAAKVVQDAYELIVEKQERRTIYKGAIDKALSGENERMVDRQAAIDAQANRLFGAPPETGRPKQLPRPTKADRDLLRQNANNPAYVSNWAIKFEPDAVTKVFNGWYDEVDQRMEDKAKQQVKAGEKAERTWSEYFFGE